MTFTAPVRITERQREVLRFIAWFQDRHLRTPTHEEIGRGLGFTQQTASYHVRRLALAGCLTQVEGRSCFRKGWRGIILSPQGEQLGGLQ